MLGCYVTSWTTSSVFSWITMELGILWFVHIFYDSSQVWIQVLCLFLCYAPSLFLCHMVMSVPVPHPKPVPVPCTEPVPELRTKSEATPVAEQPGLPPVPEETWSCGLLPRALITGFGTLPERLSELLHAALGGLLPGLNAWVNVLGDLPTPTGPLPAPPVSGSLLQQLC